MDGQSCLVLESMFLARSQSGARVGPSRRSAFSSYGLPSRLTLCLLFLCSAFSPNALPSLLMLFFLLLARSIYGYSCNSHMRLWTPYLLWTALTIAKQKLIEYITSIAQLAIALLTEVNIPQIFVLYGFAGTYKGACAS